MQLEIFYTIMERKGHVYGTFYAAKKAIIEHGEQMSAVRDNVRKKEEANDKWQLKLAKKRCHGEVDITRKTPSPHKQTSEGARAPFPTIPKRKFM